MRRIAFHAVGLLCTLLLCGLPLVSGRTAELPHQLTDTEFWRIVSDTSEPNGFFHSDNLLSNEARLQHVIPNLLTNVGPAVAYLGVGPEQNFTYIASLRPRIAFIVDVRRGNLQLHLMYKALFELSPNRAAFVARLFSKPPQHGLGSEATAEQIFEAFAQIEADEDLYKANIAELRSVLLARRGLPLSADDIRGIETIYHAFYWFGPLIQYRSTQGFGGWSMPTYAELMTARDGEGQPRGYLASEERYAFVRELQMKNLVIPVVGNFAGPKALRTVGAYLKDRNATVSAFYLSNVEQYLGREGTWPAFCANIAALPVDDRSTFIRSVRTGQYVGGGGLSSQLGNMAEEAKNCAVAR